MRISWGSSSASCLRPSFFAPSSCRKTSDNCSPRALALKRTKTVCGARSEGFNKININCRDDADAPRARFFSYLIPLSFFIFSQHSALVFIPFCINLYYYHYFRSLGFSWSTSSQNDLCGTWSLLRLASYPTALNIQAFADDVAKSRLWTAPLSTSQFFCLLPPPLPTPRSVRHLKREWASDVHQTYHRWSL